MSKTISKLHLKISNTREIQPDDQMHMFALEFQLLAKRVFPDTTSNEVNVEKLARLVDQLLMLEIASVE